jgi:hypothetical protein
MGARKGDNCPCRPGIESLGTDEVGFEACPLLETFTRPFVYACDVAGLLPDVSGDAGGDVPDLGFGGRGCGGTVDGMPSFTGPVFVWPVSEARRSVALVDVMEEGLEG